METAGNGLASEHNGRRSKEKIVGLN